MPIDVGVMLPRDLPAADVVPFVRRAEELGFAELWVVEDLGFRGGVAQAAVALAVTERIRVGIGILPAGARSAAFAAMEAATLAQLFPGRIHFGVGHGMPDWMRAVGAWPARPLAALRAHVDTLQTLVRGGSVDGVGLDAACIPAEPAPVLLGVRGPRSLELSGEIADGTVLAEPVTPEYAAAARASIAASRPHRVVGYNVGSVDDDPGVAIDRARPALQWIGEPDWEPHLRPLPFADEFARLRAAHSSREEWARVLPADWVAQLALAGTPAQVRARLDELAAAGVDASVFIPVGDDPFAALDALARVL
ncbi:alkanesulfonate monooxygenase SsuD/methylene tetrahydromethanopterin reductase-like flavin-dependent oxidoreductase (luciferase family) [Microbacterium terrae]|uniref:F420-dependent glucose-6-phosphate dehydrogenase n=1 Tax=Microbacterium terrae TaxID=69369 RepID=A0A0M2HE97_9MICO|nr:LLM class flavin-dependent oxidoreductase [Microbacterium terrae]KJL43019.1 F420-dependent glucose-6-phosphate dehydrogenase [Microbacterium terrae]MBP1079343.1 alkanesulfonate monooxygenase SsuD/methylene tetrahydromethanopterin reductase-like flavin-dependent oxidoreductase (luciferase family) [Microbacterium terrae]GLJ98743.1 N5,N10-methylene tetrahydromethanopterin reductase [Microbacterium terrae]